ncbi:MAG: hypothetical protein FWF15_09950, partial [Oscillospiraceae bacterium]|nr:hypothetical protein [Oscillospiraceae bacterium]
MRIDLNGKWQLFVDDEWIPADVPGEAQLALVKDPYVGMGMEKLRKYEFYDWVYKREFVIDGLPSETAYIVFEAVDCVAEYYLNGALIGKSDNAMIPHEFDVTDYIKLGANEIKVCIFSPILEAAKLADKYTAVQSAQQGCYEGLNLRRPMSSYGWDILCRAVTSGIWRDVYVEYRPHNRIKQLYITTNAINNSGASLNVSYQIQTNIPEYKDLALKIEIFDGETIVCTHTQTIWFVTGAFGIWFDGCKLWWPRGYGDAHIYNVRAALLYGSKELDITTSVLGVRTVELKR